MHFIINYMSKDKSDKYMHEAKEYYKTCDKGDCFKADALELESNKSLLKYYEAEDCNNILTSNGREFLYKAKTVFICIFWAVALLTLVSMKNTLDSINARVHNTSSVTTK